VAKRLGVICRPDVWTLELDVQFYDYALVIACDGVWDGMTAKDVLSIAEDQWTDASQASLCITKASLKALDQRHLDDNTTNVCIFISIKQDAQSPLSQE
jgi:serine/threonine protein phosphatase PrpC